MTAGKIVLLVAALLLVPLDCALAADRSEPFVLGCNMDRMVVANQTLVLDHRLERGIAIIGERIASASENRFQHYTWRVVDNPMINAFSGPGGFVYINTGILDFVDSEDMLAAVIAHEVAHTNSNHQIELIKAERRKLMAAQFFSALISLGAQIGGGYLGARYGNSVAAAMGGEMMRQLGPELAGRACYALAISSVKGYARKQELDADTKAIQYLDKAGYDPNAMAMLLERLLAVRDQLVARKTPALSSLINAEPGLEIRLQQAQSQLGKGR
jgi:beta-barrel assembly-enhancing protease